MPDDFQYVKLPDGSYGKFAHDADDASIRSAIQKDFPDAFKQAETPKPSVLDAAKKYGNQFLTHMGRALPAINAMVGTESPSIIGLGTQLYKKFTHQPNTLGEIPGKAAVMLAAPEEEAAEGAAEAIPTKTGPPPLWGLPKGGQSAPLGEIPITAAKPMAESGEALATKPTARDLVAKPIPIQQAVQQARAINVPPPKPVPTLPAEGGMRITDPSAAATINRDLAIPTRRATDIVRPQAIRVLPKEEFNFGEGPFQFKNGESALNHYGNVLSKSDMESLAEKRGIPKAQIDKLLAEGKTVKGTGEGGHITGEDVKANVKSEVPTTKLWNAITDTYTPEELDALQDRANKLRPALSPEGRTLGKGTKAMQAIVKRAFFPELAATATGIASLSSTGQAQEKPKGLKVPGNINLDDRPVIRNADGSRSTEYSHSFGTDKGEVLVPTVVNGKFLTPDGKKPREGSPEERKMFKRAEQHYRDTGEHMGIFDSPGHATAYAKEVHNRQDARTRK